jgi:hypothetical protein
MGVHAPAMITKIRLRVGDMQGTKFSDYEVVSALNDARTMLWIALAENFSSIPRRRVNLTLTDGRALLPEDFYSLVEEPCGAEIDGFYLVRTRPVRLDDGAEDVIELEYNGLPLPSEDLNYAPGEPLFEVSAIPGGVRITYDDYAPPGIELFDMWPIEGGVKVIYNGVAREGGDDAYTTPLPLVMDVVEISAYILVGNSDGAAAVAKSTAARVSQKREYARIPNRRPFL